MSCFLLLGFSKEDSYLLLLLAKKTTLVDEWKLLQIKLYFDYLKLLQISGITPRKGDLKLPHQLSFMLHVGT